MHVGAGLLRIHRGWRCRTSIAPVLPIHALIEQSLGSMNAPAPVPGLTKATMRAESRYLLGQVVTRAPRDVAKILAQHSDEQFAAVLTLMNPAQAQRVLQG